MRLLGWLRSLFDYVPAKPTETPEEMVRRVWAEGDAREADRKRLAWDEWQRIRSRPHAAYCDTNMPSAAAFAADGAVTKCNCDGSDPATNNLLDAIRALEEAEANLQRKLFGRTVLPPISQGTDFETKESPHA